MGVQKSPVPALIYNCSTSAVDNVEGVRKAIHEAVEIKCFYEGTSTLLLGTQTVTVKAGDVVVINPYEFHATIDRGEEGNTGKYHLFMVPLDFFSGCNLPEMDLRVLLYGQKRLLRNYFARDEQLYQLLLTAAREYNDQDTAWEARVYGLLLEVFSLLFRRGVKDTQQEIIANDAMRSYRLIEPALRHIRDHYMDAVSVEELATICQVSKHYFCRVFKNTMGKTAMEYLQEYRLMIADVMLGNTDKSIAQIAAGCGFESGNYFGRCYKKYFGISPSKRRNY